MSAAFLAVRLSQIYGARHFVWMRGLDDDSNEEFEHLRTNIDLLLTSAGEFSADASNAGFLESWYLENASKSNDHDAAGDIALHVVDSQGHPIDVGDDARLKIDDTFSPQLNWHELGDLFRKYNVLVVLCGQKPRVARALLIESRLVNRAIVSSDIATRLLQTE